MAPKSNLGGSFTFPGTNLSVNRMGYGAMQLPGKGVWGPPRDRDAALAVLREAVAQGIDHIDTADFYGPKVSNELIREALAPYADDLVIVTKIGARRGEDQSWIHDTSRDHLISSVEDNLTNLGLDAIDVVNLRLADADHEPELEEPLAVLAELQSQGLVRHIGLSNVTADQFARASGIADIVCVQNHYNVAHRGDDAFIDDLAKKGVAYVPFFPLGGFSPLQSTALSTVAEKLESTPMQVALAWLLRRSANILLIPGTSSVDHLHENIAAATLDLPADSLADLDAIGAETTAG